MRLRFSTSLACLILSGCTGAQEPVPAPEPKPETEPALEAEAEPKPKPEAPRPPPKPLLEKLGLPPSWTELDRYQGKITREVFEAELIRNYAEDPKAIGKMIQIFPDHAEIVRNSWFADQTWTLRFAAEETENPPPRYWRSAQQLPPLSDPEKPLEGMRIAVDPGHIGGEFAKMEARWFQIREDTLPVMEGEVALRVGEILRDELTRLGARVALVRRENKPVTRTRPADYVDYIREFSNFPPDADPETDLGLLRAAERTFYLSSEIRARAKQINDDFRPDLALCLHVNAEAWGDPADPDFVDKNHFHILTSGCFSAGEIKKDDQRFELLRRLLQRTHPEELAVATTVAEVMSEAINLPEFTYKGKNAKMVGKSPYVWSRNLLATRIFECPVVFFEPYVMNNQTVHDRVQEGEYRGIRKVNGEWRIDLFREYAHGVAAGVAEHYRKVRRRS
jgi:N-acetylmuramoyl-L-alanine amidase